MLVFVVYWQCKVILVSLGSAQCDGLLSFFFVFSCTHHLCLRVHGDNEMRLQLMCHVPLECNPSYKSNSWECERYLIKEIVLEVRTIGTLFTYGFFYFFSLVGRALIFTCNPFWEFASPILSQSQRIFFIFAILVGFQHPNLVHKIDQMVSRQISFELALVVAHKGLIILAGIVVSARYPPGKYKRKGNARISKATIF